MAEEAKSSADPGAFPNFVHRIAKVGEWHEALRVGYYKGTAIDQRDGYIHLSTAKQAKGTAALYFKGQEDLVLITVGRCCGDGCCRCGFDATFLRCHYCRCYSCRRLVALGPSCNS